MKTIHKIIFKNSKKMNTIPSSSAHLVVTSPPYPMIEMWDDMFQRQSKEIAKTLKHEKGLQAFELMHQELDPVWKEVHRILTDGGIACINIGDAVRTIDKEFRLYPNHARILSAMLEIGFSALPLILWRKPTNAPNKFMGSGMLRPGPTLPLSMNIFSSCEKAPNENSAAPAKNKAGVKAPFSGKKEMPGFRMYGLI